ncbi:MAG TPA: glycerophosphodiester phosphodiesterase [Gemmatimonadaceae bacterium]|jgi:glycerophosphoryl diester phosphodiesterase|nr:glycerophosphodiester phosphodiesterase [Gemmatimonadaceae bacterium]
MISHRGAHQTLPENSIPAFLRAIELGAEAIELDVHGTRDGELVVHHDREVNAPDKPSRRIADLSAAEVRDFPLENGIEIPTLAAVLDAVRPGVTIYVEIKAQGIEPLVVRQIREHPATCAVHSFDHRIVKTVKSIFPAVRTGVLQVARHVDPVAALVATGAQDLWQDVSFIDEDLVARAHAINARVIAWTANDAEQWETLRRIGVDGICTDLIAELATFKW